MANIRTGSIVSDIRGKVGSEIYSRNRGGAYVKAYSGYTENWNARQIASQTALTAANSLWQSLTESERRQWDTFANSFDASSYFVNKRFSGRTLFIKLTFQKRYYTGQTTPSFPFIPSNLSWNRELSVNINESGNAFNVNSPLAIKNNAYTWCVKASVCVPPTRRSRNSVTLNYFSGSIQLNTGFPNLFSNYESYYGAGALQAGMRVFVERLTIHIGTGVIMQVIPRSYIVQ